MSEVVPPTTTAPQPTETASESGSLRRMIALSAGGLGGVIIVIFLIGLALALFSDSEQTAPRVQVIRDIFIIILTLEGILIILALAVVVLQIARVVNLIQNEVKPILDNTQETVTTAKGTADFVGQNVAEPVIRLNAFLAGASVMMREIGGIRRAIRHEQQEQIDDETEG